MNKEDQPRIHRNRHRNQEQSEGVKEAGREWRWYAFSDHAEAKAHPDYAADPVILQWLSESTARIHNRTLATARHAAVEDSVLNGTLSLDMAPNKRDNNLLIHYFVKKDLLILIGDLGVGLTRTDEQRLAESMLACQAPIDALLVLLSEILEFFFIQSDRFEQSLHAMEEEMRTRNDKRILKQTINLRNDLTYWNAQIIPIKEIRYASEETFRSDVEESDCKHILDLRLRRIGMLQREYNEEIDSLLRVDENITNYRSNDIMKALTLYTVLLTPTTALGAIWGMNFEHMPELSWPLGYAFALAVILASTGATYWWLKQRGLTADILNMNTDSAQGSRTGKKERRKHK
ncbi:magnesium transporter CorA family protein [Saccharibacillus sacchari]|uniref:magnesium transporter CorA family protein n=1 Tax=Saccharibacillus sacchari TaxID=456493 RepID=UPI0004B37518|nr:magnesium transporter CorA family protein [Saccharibacillus sacchari]